MPISAPGELASRLRVASTPRASQLIEFKWSYSGRDGRFGGEGAVRVNPPDSVRLDLLGPGWSGIQSAILVGDDVRYVGEQKIELPPPTFLWAMLGVFRPPTHIAPVGSLRGERSELEYQLSKRERVVFEFDEVGRLVAVERRIGDHTVQRIRIKPDRGGASNGSAWPKEARFRDLGEYHEVRVKVKSARDHAPFESRLFSVAARSPTDVDGGGLRRLQVHGGWGIAGPRALDRHPAVR